MVSKPSTLAAVQLAGYLWTSRSAPTSHPCQEKKRKVITGPSVARGSPRAHPWQLSTWLPHSTACYACCDAPNTTRCVQVGQAFIDAADQYVRKFLNNGVPSLFSDLKPLYRYGPLHQASHMWVSLTLGAVLLSTHTYACMHARSHARMHAHTQTNEHEPKPVPDNQAVGGCLTCLASTCYGRTCVLFSAGIAYACVLCF